MLKKLEITCNKKIMRTGYVMKYITAEPKAPSLELVLQNTNIKFIINFFYIFFLLFFINLYNKFILFF